MSRNLGGLLILGAIAYSLVRLYFNGNEYEWYYHLIPVSQIGILIWFYQDDIIDFFKSNRDKISFKFNKRKKVMKNKSKKSLFESAFFQYLKNNQIVTAVLILVLAFVFWKLLSIFSCMGYNYKSFSYCLYIDMIR